MCTADNGSRALLSRADGARTGTFRWHPARGRVRLVSSWPAWRASLRADRLAYFDGDTYAGGCQVVVTLSRPRRTWWRSCAERVEAFSPTGRMVTVDLLADGISPREASVRRPRGGLLARYRVAGWFGALTWEDPTSLVLYAVGPPLKTAPLRSLHADRTGQNMIVAKTPAGPKPTRS